MECTAVRLQHISWSQAVSHRGSGRLVGMAFVVADSVILLVLSVVRIRDLVSYFVVRVIFFSLIDLRLRVQFLQI